MADSEPADPAGVNSGRCVAMMTEHTRQPQVMINPSDPDNDGDASGDTDMDGDGRPSTIPIARLKGRQ